MGKAKEKTKGFVAEFKEFVTKGNVIDKCECGEYIEAE